MFRAVIRRTDGATIKAVTKVVAPWGELHNSRVDEKAGIWKFDIVHKEGCECGLCTALGLVKDAVSGVALAEDVCMSSVRS